jgi:hypothetical protein
MRSDVFLFIGIILLLFLVWIATGGPSRPISFAGPYITPLAPGIGGQGYSLSRTGTTTTRTGTNVTTAGTNNTLRSVQQGVVNLEKSVVSSVRFGTPSPYKGLVTIQKSTSGIRPDEANSQYIIVSVSSRATTPISFYNWRVMSEANNYSARIPGAVPLPHTGDVNTSEPLSVSPGQRVIITIGDSPVGMSFRENMCTGYFDQFQNFTPQIPHSCPVASSDFDRFYLGNIHSLDACKAYIKTVQRCTLPLYPPNGLADNCYQFIDKYLNYNGCAAAHQGDAGFYGTTWRVYMGHEEVFFTKDHDTVKLLDADGKTVDAYSY